MALFSRRSSISSKTKRNQARNRRLRIERLEEREVLTATVFVDFGDDFGSGLAMTVAQLRDGLYGPNMNDGTYNDSTSLTFKPFSTEVDFDYNGDSSVNGTDATALKADVFALIQRAYAPFDVTVTQVASDNMTDIGNYLSANNAVFKHHDAYVIVAPVFVTGTSNSVGLHFSAYGVAPPDSGNTSDNTALAFADVILAGYGNSDADTATAFTTAHEAGHTFGLDHSLQTSTLSNSDFMSGSGTTINRVNVDFFTRYPLPKESGGGTQNAFDIFATNYLEIGASSSLNYVSGTGAKDVITIVRSPDYTVLPLYNDRFAVSISTYEHNGTPIGSTSYYISATPGIRVEMGLGDDTLIIDGALGGLGQTVNVYGMGGTDTLKLTNFDDMSQSITNSITADGMVINYAPTGAGESNTIIEKVILEGNSDDNNFTIRSLSAATSFEVIGLGGTDEVDILAPTGSTAAFAQDASVDEVILSLFSGGGWTTQPGRLKYNQTGGDVVEKISFHGDSGNDELRLYRFGTGTDFDFIGGGGSDSLYLYARSAVTTGFDQTASGDEIIVYEYSGSWNLQSSSVKYNQGGDTLENVIINGDTGDDVVKLYSFSVATAYQFIGNGGTNDQLYLFARAGIMTGFDQTVAGDQILVYEYTGGTWNLMPASVKFVTGADNIESVLLNGDSGNDVAKIRKLSTATTFYFYGNAGTDYVEVTLNGATLHSSGTDWVRYKKGATVYQKIYRYSATVTTV